MPQLPAGWHPQAAKRGSSTLAWRPGWRGTGAQPIRAVPVGRYTQKISGVPLTGGQAQGQIPGYPGVSGSVTSPASFVGIAGEFVPTGGTFTVQWSVSLGGTAGAGDANNFLLLLNATPLATSVNAGAPGNYPQAAVPGVVMHAGDALVVFSGGSAPTA